MKYDYYTPYHIHQLRARIVRASRTRSSPVIFVPIFRPETPNDHAAGTERTAGRRAAAGRRRRSTGNVALVAVQNTRARQIVRRRDVHRSGGPILSPVRGRRLGVVARVDPREAADRRPSGRAGRLRGRVVRQTAVSGRRPVGQRRRGRPAHVLELGPRADQRRPAAVRVRLGARVRRDHVLTAAREEPTFFFCVKFARVPPTNYNLIQLFPTLLIVLICIFTCSRIKS